MKLTRHIIAIAVIAVLFLQLAASCSKDEDKVPSAADLLATVPARSAAAGCIATDQLMSLVDAREQGGKITCCPELTQFAARHDVQKSVNAILSAAFCTSERMVFFVYNDKLWLTAGIADDAKFDALAKELKATSHEAPFADVKKALSDAGMDDRDPGTITIYTLPDGQGGFLRRGRQLWLCLDPETMRAEPALREVVEFAAMEREESYLEDASTRKAASELAAADAPALLMYAKISTALGTLGRLVSSVGDYAGYATIGMATLYSSPSFMRLQADVSDADLTLETSVLDQEFVPCGFNLPAGKVSAKVLQSVSFKGGDRYAALALPPAFVEKVTAIVGAGIPDDLAASLRAIDGTAAVCLGSGNTTKLAVETAPGASATALQPLLALAAPVRGLRLCKEGNVALAGTSGTAPLQALPQFAKELAGSVAGVAANLHLLNPGKWGEGAYSLITLVPQGKSVMLRFRIHAANPLRNLLREPTKSPEAAVNKR